MSRRISFLVLLAMVLGVVGCDQGTKQLAEDRLAEAPPHSVVSGRVDLRYAQNHGVAFNAERLLPEPVRAPLAMAGGALALLFLCGMWWRRRGGLTVETAGFALIVGGALGNIVDRIARGYVVDFVHVRGWPIFNVADVAIVAGAACLGLAMLMQARQHPSARRAG